MFGYIYKTTNLVNGKIYIGQKKSEKFVPKYLGSGINLMKAVRKYGKENFSVEIIEECLDKDILNEREKFWIVEFNALDRLVGYNISRGGQGSDIPCSEETKRKISLSHKGVVLSQEHKRKVSESLKRLKGTFITWRGRTQHLKDWSEELGIHYSALQARLRRGWDIEKAFTTPTKYGLIEFEGQKKTMTQWCKILGVSLETIRLCKKKLGCSVQEAFMRKRKI